MSGFFYSYLLKVTHKERVSDTLSTSGYKRHVLFMSISFAPRQQFPFMRTGEEGELLTKWLINGLFFMRSFHVGFIVYMYIELYKKGRPRGVPISVQSFDYNFIIISRVLNVVPP